MIVQNDIEQMLHSLKVRYDIRPGNNKAKFTINMFGVIILFNSSEIANVDGWEVVYVDEDEHFESKRMDIIWTLMRSGYMCYLRMEYEPIFKDLLINRGWDRKIINKRLELWGDQAKYGWLVKLNTEALTQPTTFMLSSNPGFFDFL